MVTRRQSSPARKHAVLEDLQSLQDAVGTSEHLQEAHLENRQLSSSEPSRNMKNNPLRHFFSNF